MDRLLLAHPADALSDWDVRRLELERHTLVVFLKLFPSIFSSMMEHIVLL